MSISACGLTPRLPAPVQYDLGAGGMPAAQARSPLTVQVVSVTAPPWMDDTGIIYRFTFQNPYRRERYRDSRWVAAPAEMVRERIRERFAPPVGKASVGTAPAALLPLRVELEEFEQEFTDARHSHVVVRLRASLSGAAPGEAPREHRLEVDREAATPDAPGAVAAFSGAVDEAIDQLGGWAGAHP